MVPGYRLELRPVVTLRPKDGLWATLIALSAGEEKTSSEHLLQVAPMQQDELS
ncbi:MAG: hypothetical protein ACJ8BW_40060 [Ktedonobacteraceae bacterium]